MRYLLKHPAPTISASSMADVAFLLLSFFMVTTVIREDRGIAIKLPPLMEETSQPVHERNLYSIHVNSANQYLAEGVVRGDLTGLRSDIKRFIMNRGASPSLSDNPEKAVVSIKADRGTSHAAFIAVLDEVQAAYYELYAEQAGISATRFRNLNLQDPREKLIYEKGRKGIPMNISIAESTPVMR